MNNKNHVRIFFRCPNKGFYSIENVFNQVVKNFPKDIKFDCCYLRRSSKGLFRILSNIFYAFIKRADINHISGDITYIAPFLLGRKKIVTFHDLESLEREFSIKNFILKYFWLILPSRSADIITVISEHTKDKILKTLKGLNPQKVRVIYDPVLIKPPEKHKKKINSKPIILAVGTKKNKNLENTIKSLIGLKCKLLIVGRINEKQLKLLESSSIEYENIYDVSNEEIEAAYSRSDILCFPSFYEGFGLPIIEAQSSGCPVITSDYGAMKEIAGEGALLVNPLGTSEISEAVKRLLSDDLLRSKLIEKGFENIKRFAPENIALQYAAVYTELDKKISRNE